MYKDAYIGSYWYTVNASNGGWGLGGCIYANYIYPDGLPERVKEACSKPEGTCTKNSTSACTPTTEDDQAAYTNYQVQRISDVISNIFG